MIEVMVSASLLIVGLSAALQGYTSTTNRAARDRHLTQAIHVAESTAEALLIFDQADPDLSAGDHVDVMQFDSVGQQVSAGGRYLASWHIDANTPINAIRRIAITVRWIESGGGTTTMTVHRR
jgi:type II secretory pathway pseudopilin PulG